MMYVLAFEEDGYGRDVTRKYAREYSAKVAKAQAGGGGRGRQLWWELVVQTISRPYRLVLKSQFFPTRMLTAHACSIETT